MLPVFIRLVQESELPVLDRIFRSEFRRTHRDDLADQQAQILSFYVAWLEIEPVGHGFVRWAEPRDSLVRSAYPDCPEIYRLGVEEKFRGRGIGTQIIASCETEAISRGLEIIGVGVDFNNPKAWELYRRLGYRQSTVIECRHEYKRERKDGTVETIREPGTFLIKSLRIQSGPRGLTE